MNAMAKIDEAFLEKATGEIRELMRGWSRNTLKLGARLQEVRDRCFPQVKETVLRGKRGKTVSGKVRARPGWKAWLRDEVHLSASYASALIICARRFANKPGAERLSVSVMRFLAANVASEEAISDLIEEAKHKKVTVRRARKRAHDALPGAEEANRRAQETGKPQLASDGYIYLGASAEEAKKGELRRTVVYGVRRAVETIAILQISPAQFLEFALPHQLWADETEDKQLFGASQWLSELSQHWTLAKHRIRGELEAKRKALHEAKRKALIAAE